MDTCKKCGEPLMTCGSCYHRGDGHTVAEKPKDMVMMPQSLTAENGAKGLLSGEFLEKVILQCEYCDDGWEDEEAGEECQYCGGSGDYSLNVPVQWTTIKEIYAMAVKHLQSYTRQPNRMNKRAYQQMIDEDIEVLHQLPRTLERDHIEHVLRHSIIVYYGD